VILRWLTISSTLCRSGWVAKPAEEAIILVSIPKSLREDAAKLELDLYLRVWEATHNADSRRRDPALAARRGQR
jgi:hypothetical protein